jgi:methylmalonyl-CoA mutase N-terminal domain/subunit
MAPERAQIAEVQALRARRDDGRTREGLDEVRRACAGSGNVMNAVLEAARRDATLGEICRVFRDVFGEYRDPAEV